VPRNWSRPLRQLPAHCGGRGSWVTDRLALLNSGYPSARLSCSGQRGLGAQETSLVLSAEGIQANPRKPTGAVGLVSPRDPRLQNP
jgi:hypothetical protein